MNISRRQFIKSSLVGLGLVSTSFLLQDFAYGLELCSLKIPVQGLAHEFDGYRIGFLSDLHLGPFVPKEWVEQAIIKIANEHVDILLLGGDYQGVPDSTISKSFGAFRNKDYAALNPGKKMAEAVFADILELFSLVKPPNGILAVFGNHDRRNHPDICAFTFAQREDLSLLENDVAMIKRGTAFIEIIGVADYLTGVPRLPKIISPSTSILLSHNPDYVSKLLDNSTLNFALALCGHTHGGQIKFPLIGALNYNVKDLRLAEGLNWFNSTPVYTSRGVGMVELPFRMNCPAEATVLTLECA